MMSAHISNFLCQEEIKPAQFKRGCYAICKKDELQSLRNISITIQV